MTTNMMSSSSLDDQTRLKELEAFDNTKLGVKGLVDLGITKVPSMFLHPPNESLQPDLNDDTHHHLIPVIDLLSPQPGLVNQVKEAAAEFGFFQVINHGIPLSLLDRVLETTKAFFELPPDDKVRYYRRYDMDAAAGGVKFISNYDLYKSKAATWRDSLEIRLGPTPIDPNAIPHVCREEAIEWDKEVMHLAHRLMGLLFEGLGLSEDKLKEQEYLGKSMGALMVCNYYPCCPEPNKTIGIVSHTDPAILTILLQDQVGGLQVKHNGMWINVKPVHGALVINIGDLFQMISNDEYISGEHRVIPHPEGRSRVSVVTFFGSDNSEKWYGPLPDLVSPEKPALYSSVQYSNYVKHFVTKELDGKPMTHYFRL